MEIENAVNQAKKELANRFDFKGSNAEIVLEKNEIKLSAADQFKIKALHEIVINKLAKRQISLKSVESAPPKSRRWATRGRSSKSSKASNRPPPSKSPRFIRDTKLKVTTQIQGEAIRVTGKSRDDLQAVIAAVRGHEFPAGAELSRIFAIENNIALAGRLSLGLSVRWPGR